MRPIRLISTMVIKAIDDVVGGRVDRWLNKGRESLVLGKVPRDVEHLYY